ncbi:universal stress protein [Fodinibius sp.]|uniref:universal stress protein n=1 Tax=Fodinibius sp. TaxID=1872440 RepID=UPI003563AE46
MYTINKILVPTDFSENASNAYSHARQIAGRYGAKIDFIHIIPTLEYFNESLQQLDMPLDMDKEVYPDAQERASVHITELMNDHLEPENKGEGIVRIAPKPSKAIAEYAEQGSYDLIVIAAKGRHESDLLRGSVTEKLIRYSTVPVLHTDQPSIERIKNIMVPTDGSPASLQALPVAVSIALRHNASITLFHGLEKQETIIENALEDPYKSSAENIRDSIYDAVDEFFRESWDKVELRRGQGFESQFVVSTEASSAIVDVETVIEKGVSAHYAITSYGDEYADLMVLATHGHSGLKHLILGSTAEKVVRHSATPTVTVKPDFV